MQKKLIALAIAGLSGAAFAQSNVTIYGVMDGTFDSVSATGATAANSDLGGRSRVSSNSSYIGFKGVESLGNGLAVAFQIENGLQSENGAAGVWNNRDTYVGLAGGFGTVAIGNVTGPTRALGAKFDVNAGATGIGANTALLGKGALTGAGASAFDQRITNAIAYISPNLSGFSGVVGYSTGVTNTVLGTTLSGKENSAAGTDVKGNTAWTLGLNYENGPFYIGYAYTQVNTTNSGATAPDGLLGVYQKAKDNRLGAMWNFGAGTVGLLYDRPTYTTSNNAAFWTPLGIALNKDRSQTIWYLPVTFNVGAGKIIAQYGHAGNVTDSPNTGAKHFEIGYEYSMSKRTTLKALWSQISNDSNAAADFLYGVSAGNTTGTSTGVPSAGSDPKGISIGIRHSF
ncbi:MAG TPA: porin [Rhodocyclaceae bacterium]